MRQLLVCQYSGGGGGGRVIEWVTVLGLHVVRSEPVALREWRPEARLVLPTVLAVKPVEILVDPVELRQGPYFELFRLVGEKLLNH